MHRNPILYYVSILGHNTKNELVIKGSAILLSPGYPENYPRNILQKYHLKAKRGFKIRLIFNYFHLEKNFDFVRIYDGHNSSSPTMAHLTGIIDVPYILSSSGNEVLFVFFSDYVITKRGFKVTYQQVHEFEQNGKWNVATYTVKLKESDEES